MDDWGTVKFVKTHAPSTILIYKSHLVPRPFAWAFWTFSGFWLGALLQALPSLGKKKPARDLDEESEPKSMWQQQHHVHKEMQQSAWPKHCPKHLESQMARLGGFTGMLGKASGRNACQVWMCIQKDAKENHRSKPVGEGISSKQVVVHHEAQAHREAGQHHTFLAARPQSCWGLPAKPRHSGRPGEPNEGQEFAKFLHCTYGPSGVQENCQLGGTNSHQDEGKEHHKPWQDHPKRGPPAKKVRHAAPLQVKCWPPPPKAKPKKSNQRCPHH